VVFDKLVPLLGFGGNDREIADHPCSATTGTPSEPVSGTPSEQAPMGTRRWGAHASRSSRRVSGCRWVPAVLEQIVLEAYDAVIGLEPSDLVRLHHQGPRRGRVRRP